MNRLHSGLRASIHFALLWSHRQRSIVLRGLYYAQVARLYSLFPREDILVVQVSASLTALPVFSESSMTTGEKTLATTGQR